MQSGAVSAGSVKDAVHACNPIAPHERKYGQLAKPLSLKKMGVIGSHVLQVRTQTSSLRLGFASFPVRTTRTHSREPRSLPSAREVCADPKVSRARAHLISLLFGCLFNCTARGSRPHRGRLFLIACATRSLLCTLSCDAGADVPEKAEDGLPEPAGGCSDYVLCAVKCAVTIVLIGAIYNCILGLQSGNVIFHMGAYRLTGIENVYFGHTVAKHNLVLKALEKTNGDALSWVRQLRHHCGKCGFQLCATPTRRT